MMSCPIVGVKQAKNVSRLTLKPWSLNSAMIGRDPMGPTQKTSQ